MGDILPLFGIGLNDFKKPILLSGNPSVQAIDRVEYFISKETFSKSEFEQNILRTKIIIGFNAGTTVAKANELIQTIKGSFVRTYKKTAILEMRIPDSGSKEAAEKIVNELRKRPIVSFVMTAKFFSLQ